MTFALGRLGASFGKLGAGVGGPFTPGFSLTAPVATWVSAAGVSQATFDIGIDALAQPLDTIYGESYTDAGLTSLFDTEEATIQAPDFLDRVISDFAFSPFTPSGTYYVRFCLRRGGIQISPWSDTISKAIDLTAPTITSANSANNAENAVLAHALTANETVTWSLNGGADAAKFEISGSTLRWLSNGTKDYEVPDDSGTNNVYNVTVRATDTAGNTTDQNIAITVTDVGEGPTPILDTYTGAAFAVSAARKLRSAYGGSCMKVREMGGTTDADIGFTANALNETALTAHTGANNGLIRTWYDQSGNALDALGNAFSDSNNFKPSIVLSGAVNKFNTKPSVLYDTTGNADSLYVTSPGAPADASCTVLVVFNRTTTASVRALFGGTTGSLYARLTAAHKIEVLREQQASIFTTTTTVPQQLCAAIIVIDDTGTSSVKINANAAETFTTDVTATAALRMVGGTQIDGNNLSGGSQFDSGFSELIVWPTAFNNTNRDAALADAISFYGIT